MHDHITRRIDFEETFREHASSLYSLAYRLVGSYDDAADLFQETMVKVWRKWDQRKNKHNSLPWMRKIVINTFIDNLRKKKIRESAFGVMFPIMDNVIVSETPLPDDEFIVDEEIRMIHSQCFSIIASNLPIYQRIVFTLIDVFKISISETALIIGRSVSATKSLLYRARKKMVEQYSPHCGLVREDNFCQCKAWLRFTSDVHQRREYLQQVIKQTVQSKEATKEIRQRVIHLFRLLPPLTPPSEWLEKLLKSG